MVTTKILRSLQARRLFINSIAQTTSLDANTCKERWHTKLGDINLGETITMAIG